MPGLSASRWAAPRLAKATYYSSISDYPNRSDNFYTPATATTATAATAPSSSTNVDTASTTLSTSPAHTTVPPQQPGGNGAPRDHHRSPLDELTRYTKIVRRLKWKLPYLASGYLQAVDRHNLHPAQAAEAELMFKLDFFEYYMLLERALVHLLGVFGTSVPRGFSQRHLQALSRSRWAPPSTTRNGDLQNGDGSHNINSTDNNNDNNGRNSPLPSHRYHANVLEALDNPANPLHPILGLGEVRRQLGRAKDLRNRWKNADDSSGGGTVGRKTMAVAPLESYDPERILTTIFDGLDEAFIVAEQFVLRDKVASVEGGNGGGSGGGSGGGGGREDDSTATAAAAAAMDQEMRDAFSEGVGRMVTEEEQWEFMVEAMDWEAV